MPCLYVLGRDFDRSYANSLSMLCLMFDVWWRRWEAWMKEIEFHVGDVVVLKSGSIRMTVQKFFDGNEVQCVWFDPKQELQVGTFVLQTLERA